MRTEEKQDYRISEAERPVFYRNALPGDASLFLLRIHSFESGQPSGEVVNLYAEEIESFSGYAEAFLIMDRVMDRLNFPQSATVRRCLAESSGRRRQISESENKLRELQPKYQYWSCEALRRGGRKLNFLIRIIYRQNSSWQGQLNFNGRKVIFRSALELLHLLTEAEQAVRSAE